MVMKKVIVIQDHISFAKKGSPIKNKSDGFHGFGWLLNAWNDASEEDEGCGEFSRWLVQKDPIAYHIIHAIKSSMCVEEIAEGDLSDFEKFKGRHDFLKERIEHTRLALSFLEDWNKGNRLDMEKSKDRIMDVGGVYFLRQKNTRLVKIGKSQNPKKRILQLMRGAAKACLRLEELHVYLTPHYDEEEKRLHGIYREYKTDGEWFRLPKNTIDLICEGKIPE